MSPGPTPTRPAFTAIWRYHVQPDMVDDFQRRYGPSGDWAQLFPQWAGHLGTALLKDQDD